MFLTWCKVTRFLSNLVLITPIFHVLRNLCFILLVEEDTGNASRWKEFLLERTHERQNVNLMQLVYGASESKSAIKAELQQHGTENDESDTEFFVPKGEGTKVCPYTAHEIIKLLVPRSFAFGLCDIHLSTLCANYVN